MSLKDNILNADDLRSETVFVEEWNTKVTIRTMTGTERDAFELELSGPEGKQNARAKLLVRCIADESGNRVFQDSDALALGKKSSKALDKLWDIALDLNRVRKKDVEEAEKN